MNFFFIAVYLVSVVFNLILVAWVIKEDGRVDFSLLGSFLAFVFFPALNTVATLFCITYIVTRRTK